MQHIDVKYLLPGDLVLIEGLIKGHINYREVYVKSLYNNQIVSEESYSDLEEISKYYLLERTTIPPSTFPGNLISAYQVLSHTSPTPNGWTMICIGSHYMRVDLKAIGISKTFAPTEISRWSQKLS